MLAGVPALLSELSLLVPLDLFMSVIFSSYCSDKEFLGWTPETEDGTDTIGLTTNLFELRTKYQSMKKAGIRPAEVVNAASGLKGPKAPSGAVPSAATPEAASNAKLASAKRPARI